MPTKIPSEQERMARRRASRLKWATANPEKDREAKNKWQNANTDRHLRTRYGITRVQWETMFNQQGRACAICFSESPGANCKWHTDHCHATGKVREILCAKCNAGLGMFRDNPALFERAADYIRKHSTPAGQA